MPGDVIVGDCERLAGQDRTRGAASLQCLRQPEIEHLHRAVVCELDVGGLQIAMHNSAFMRRVERLGDLTGDRQRFVERDWALRDAIGERRAVDKLEHQRPLRTRLPRAHRSARCADD